jgi:hypothetical protein
MAYSAYLAYEDFDEMSSRIASAEWVDSTDNMTPATLFPGEELGTYKELSSYTEGYYIFKDKNGNEIDINEISAVELARYFYNSGEEFQADKWIKNFDDPYESMDFAYHVLDYFDKFEYLEKEEIDVLAYLSATDNTTRLESYDNFTFDLWQKRWGKEEADKIIQKAEENYDMIGSVVPIPGLYNGETGEMETGVYTEADALLATLGLLGAEGFKNGVKQFANGIANLFSSDGKLSHDEYKTQALMSYLSDKYADELLAKTLTTGTYEISTSIGNMAPSLLFGMVTGVGALGTITMGLAAAGNAREEALQSGFSNGQAWVYGILTGLSEAGLEYALGGVSKLSSGKAGKTIAEATGINRFLADMISEGTEESVQALLEPLFKTMASGGKIAY